MGARLYQLFKFSSFVWFDVDVFRHLLKVTKLISSQDFT
jgi:hypothetical protein